MTTEIKFCPFCGQQPELNFQVCDTASYKTYNLSCCVVMEGDLDPEELIAQWNRRAEKKTVAYYVPGEAGFYVAPKFMGRIDIPEKHRKTAVRLVEADE